MAGAQGRFHADIMSTLDQYGFKYDKTGAQAGSPTTATAPTVEPLPCEMAGACDQHVHYYFNDERLKMIVFTVPAEEINASTPAVVVVRSGTGKHVVSVNAYYSNGALRKRKESLNKMLTTAFDVYARMDGCTQWLTIETSSLLLQLTPLHVGQLCARLYELDREYMLAGSAEVDAFILDSDESIVKTAGRFLDHQTSSSGLADSTVAPARSTNNEKLANLYKELLSTEEHYVACLGGLMSISCDIEQLARANPSAISLPEAQNMFCGLPKIYEVNKAFLAELQAVMAPAPAPAPQTTVVKSGRAAAKAKEAQAAPQTVEAVLVKHIRNFHHYKVFVSYYQTATETIHTRRSGRVFAAMLDSIRMRPDSFRKNLTDLLIEPVQRLPRYVILVRDMLSNMHPSHSSYAMLLEAYTEMTKIASFINVEQAAADSRALLFEVFNSVSDVPNWLVSASRTFLGKFEVNEVDECSQSVRNGGALFLFNDHLMFAKKVSATKRKLASNKKAYEKKHLTDLQQIEFSSLSLPLGQILLTVDFMDAKGKFDGSGEKNGRRRTFILGGDVAADFMEKLRGAYFQRKRTDASVAREDNGRRININVHRVSKMSKTELCLPDTRMSAIVFAGADPSKLAIPPRLKNYYLVALVQITPTGFRCCLRTRDNVPVFGGSLFGDFEACSTSEFGALLMAKLLAGHEVMAVEVCRLQTYPDNLYGGRITSMLLPYILQISRSKLASRLTGGTMTPSRSSSRGDLFRSMIESRGTPSSVRRAVSVYASSTPSGTRRLEAANSLIRRHTVADSNSTPQAKSDETILRETMEGRKFVTLISAIEEKGLSNTHLYAIESRRSSAHRRLMAQIDAKVPAASEEICNRSELITCDHAVLTGLLQRLIEALPAPIIPTGLQSRVVQACNWEHPADIGRLLAGAIESLDSFPYTLLKFLVEHWKRAVNTPRSGVLIGTLDTIFTPLLMPSAADSLGGDNEGRADIAAVVETRAPLVQRLIEHSSEVFNERRRTSSAAVVGVANVSKLDLALVSNSANGTKRRRVTPDMMKLSISVTQLADGSDDALSSAESLDSPLRPRTNTPPRLVTQMNISDNFRSSRLAEAKAMVTKLKQENQSRISLLPDGPNQLETENTFEA